VSVRLHQVRRGAEVAHEEGGVAVEREAVDRTAAWSARPWTGPGVEHCSQSTAKSPVCYLQQPPGAAMSVPGRDERGAENVGVPPRSPRVMSVR
jgi:hypothetical protein